MCGMCCIMFYTLVIGLIVFAASISGQAVECETIDLNLYSGIKYNIYKKAALTDKPKNIEINKAIRL